ncbi:MAG: hypothetical protein LAO09_15195 [Acidobacteriia bacterium]|nr:hypothetical protein [Terriglobia bacterium]
METHQPDCAQSKKAEWKFCDPESDGDRKGMLLSDQIDKFCSHGLLISKNYDRGHLRPAAYTLTIGNAYVDSSGQIGSLSEEKPFLEMKPNSIVYVTTAEELDLPHYVAARFNLRVKWVYKGILLGTGPQVEPGYRGFLSCPLYNLTNRPMRIRLGDEFASIDFERTTNFCSGKSPAEIKSNVKCGEKVDEVSFDGRTYLLFKDKAYKPLQHLPDYDIVSSLVEMQREVRNWRNIGIGLVIAFVSLALSIVGLQVRMEGNVINSAKDVAKLQTELQQAQEQITSLQKLAVTSGSIVAAPSAVSKAKDSGKSGK